MTPGGLNERSKIQRTSDHRDPKNGGSRTDNKMVLIPDMEVVVMEDDLATLSYITTGLNHMGFEVLPADSSESAVQLAKDRGTKYFILDMSMGPNRNTEGLEALALLKSINPEARVGIFSAYADAPHFRRALSLGADIFVEKSANFSSSLSTIVRTLIENDDYSFLTESLTDFKELCLQNRSFTKDELESGLRDFRYSGLVDPAGRPLDKYSPQYAQILAHVQNTNDVILEKLKNDPSLISSITPREFEEFVGNLLRKLGFEVRLTPSSRDGGFDMYAASTSALGSFLYLVECKKYDRVNKVGVEIVRSLYGVLESKKATAGMIVTSSMFTKGAEDFQREVMYRVHLHDYMKIQQWLNLI